MKRETVWKALCAEAHECRRCALHESARQKVIADPPEWSGKKSILFVGEAPGENEDKEGIPFVGRSGDVLRKQIERVSIPENDFAIVNTVQCRPPDNRDPSASEIVACSQFFREKVKLLDPQVIVPLGKPACCTVFNTQSFSIVAQSCKERKSSLIEKGKRISIPAFPLPHPRWGIHHPEPYGQMWDKLAIWLSKKGIITSENP